MSQRTFPKDFTWGTATASYQIEGAVADDGRTPSIWDTFTATPGKILDGSTGAVACDSYNRLDQDMALLQALGVGAYRFSVAWPRIIPTPGGPVNRAGLDYYKRLVDALRAAGIKPVLTLYHWDLPQYLQDQGGWPNRETALRYGDYAYQLAQALGDRVDTWTTLNEPWCTAYLGYADGVHAPGLHNHPAALAAAHHLNLAHGLGVQAVKAAVGAQARTSVTLNLQVFKPASDSEADRAAVAQLERLGNGIWLGPMLDGAYDPQLLKDTAHLTDWGFVKDGDVEQCHQPLDVLGVNYYFSETIRRASYPPPNATGPWHGTWPGADGIEAVPPTGELTAMGWNQDPAALTNELVDLHRRYPDLDLMVTENGSAWDDTVSPDRQVHDPKRVAYLAAHIEAIGQALDQGVPLTGYFAWSLMDNFEWAYGYSRRFGLFYTDYETQDRLWKDTARWYQRLAQTGQVPAEGTL